MNLILSRKGFDSKSGGYPSPIFPDGSLIPLPIPASRYVSGVNFAGEKYEPIQYKNIRVPASVNKLLLKNGINDIFTYKDLMLLIFDKCRNKTFLKIKNRLLRNEPCYCHLDPDLIKDNSKRENDWVPIFGPNPRYQKNLENNIKRNDLFLFFGLYRPVVIEDGMIRFAIQKDLNNSALNHNEIHMIYGYLQVDTIIKDKKDVKNWMKNHPHLDKKLWREDYNAIYIATQELTISDKKMGYLGAGVFKFSTDLILSETNKSLNPIPSKSVWRHELFPLRCHISHQGKRVDDRKWTKSGCFQWVSRGQEFVLEDCSEFEKHVKNKLFRKNL